MSEEEHEFIMPLPPPPALCSLAPVQTVKVARVTGATPPGESLPNPNRTDQKYQVYGTDLGVLWATSGHKVMAAFGDTYGRGWGRAGGGPSSADWRSNTLALSDDADPSRGLVFTAVTHDKAGHASQFLPSRKGGTETTVIPTAGVSVGTRNYVYYMSVRRWGRPSDWQTNRAGLAYSDDNGKTWTKPSGPVWENTARHDDSFQQGAFAKQDGYVYLFGTPNGRRGDVSLARVFGPRLLDKSAYQYWGGHGWQAGDEAAAVPVARGPAGELSVVYNSFFRHWLMVSLDIDRHALVLRDAPALTGPWSGPRVLATGADYPALYGGFIDPLHNGGRDLYFTLSQWDPYNVFWMHTILRSVPSTFGG